MRLARAWLVAALSMTALALAPSAVRAQPFQGVYVGAGAGLNVPESIETTTANPSSPRLKLVPGNGFVGLGSVGYGLGNGFRFELEGNFRQSSLAHLSGTAYPTAASGKVQTYGAMANVLFDMDIGFPWIYPYVGGGAGYAATKLDNMQVATRSGVALLSSNSTEGGFAFQAIGGLSFPVYRVPGLSLTAEYRFFAVPFDEHFPAEQFGRPVTIPTHAQYNNSFLLGVRYAFGVQPPPAPPAAAAAPAPAPARTYQVFFDWDKATLTDRARQIVKEAAQASTTVHTTRIEVNGYTDTSGTPQYNKGLSIRRAEAVSAELVRDGVPRASIAIQGFGDTKLLVATGPGVREPQNRRVEIILH
jgi:outer membrane protein OmpA-like peptidoglycan-associated protein